MKLASFVFAGALLSGCVFGGEETPPLGNRDLGDGSDGAANAVTPDTAVANAMTADVGAPPDSARADQGVADMGRDDVGRPVDMAPDMPPGPEPYIVVSQHVIALGGRPSPAEPVEVSAMSVGFLLGYTDNLSDQAIFGWYSSDSATPLATDNFPADELALDVSATSEGGFGVFMSSAGWNAVWFVPNTIGTPSMTATVFSQPLNSTNHEIVAANEADTTYTVQTYDNSSGVPTVDLALVDGTGWGFASTATRTSLNMLDIEAVGGNRGVGRQILLGGVVGGNYRLSDYVFDINVSMSWTIEDYGCGTAGVNRRIVPVRQDWALLIQPTPNGPALAAVNCVPLNDTIATRLPFRSMTAQPVVDFDLAKETLGAGGDLGVAWMEADSAWFGELFFDPGSQSANLRAPMRLPVTGGRVRAAYNPMRQQWAVVVTSLTGAELVILEQNPDFP